MSNSRLQQELKKKRPFDSPDQEAILNMLRTSDQFQNRFGRLFREFDLTHSQYNVLRILRGEGKPMPCLEIGGVAQVAGTSGYLSASAQESTVGQSNLPPALGGTVKRQ